VSWAVHPIIQLLGRAFWKIFPPAWQNREVLTISNTIFEKIDQDDTEASILAKYHLNITDSKHNIIFDGDTAEQYHLIKMNDRWYITDLEQYTIPLNSEP